VHEELELKLGSHFGLKLELKIFFITITIKLLLTPKIVRQRMKNPNSNSHPILDLTLGLFYFIFCCMHFQATFGVESGLMTHGESKLKLNGT
jgi:hypothetical protein